MILEDLVQTAAALAVAIFTAILTFVSWQQWRLLRRSTTATELATELAARSVEVAERGIEIAQRSLTYANRPHIAFRPFTLWFPHEEGVNSVFAQVNFTIQNYGTAPAVNIRHSTGFRSDPTEPPDDFDWIGHLGASDPMFLVPGQTAQTQPHEVSVAEIEAIRQGTWSYHIFGLVTYQGLDGSNYKTSFLNKVTPTYDHVEGKARFDLRIVGNLNSAT